MAAPVFHTRAGRFVVPSRRHLSIPPQQAQPFPDSDPRLIGLIKQRAIKWWNSLVGGVREEGYKKKRKRVRELFLYGGGLGGALGFPPSRWACTPPLRLTSIPLSVPLTEASAQL